eukprot:2782633-Pyramimonas_sp.AAC.1
MYTTITKPIHYGHLAYHQVLLPLAMMRLCASVCMAAHSAPLDPDDNGDNTYLAVSEKPAWTLLARLDQVEYTPVHLALLLHTRHYS